MTGESHWLVYLPVTELANEFLPTTQYIYVDAVKAQLVDQNPKLE